MCESKQSLYLKQKPDELNRLIEIATAQNNVQSHGFKFWRNI